jgi:hypothetical protein
MDSLRLAVMRSLPNWIHPSIWVEYVRGSPHLEFCELLLSEGTDAWRIRSLNEFNRLDSQIPHPDFSEFLGINRVADHFIKFDK